MGINKTMLKPSDYVHLHNHSHAIRAGGQANSDLKQGPQLAVVAFEVQFGRHLADHLRRCSPSHHCRTAGYRPVTIGRRRDTWNRRLREQRGRKHGYKDKSELCHIKT